MKKTTTAFLLCLFSAFSVSGQGFWETAHGPRGGDVNAFAQDSAGTMWASLRYGDSGIYKSDDDGKNWEIVTLPQPNNTAAKSHIEVAPNGAIWVFPFYSVSDELAFRSEDGGATWQTVTMPNTTDQVPYKAAFTLNGSLLLSDNSGITRTDDNGQTWTSVFSWPNSSILFLKRSPSGDIWAGVGPTWGGATKPKVFRMASGSTTFKQVLLWPSSLAAYNYMNVEFFGNTTVVGGDKALQITTDNGLTWTARNLPGIATNYAFIKLASGKLLAANDSDPNLHFSTDLGQTWQTKPQPMPDNPLYPMVLFSAKNGKLTISSASSDIWNSENEGDSWTYFESGIYAAFGIGIFNHEPSHAVYCLHQKGIYRSFDEGETWLRANHEGGTDMAFMPNGDAFLLSIYGKVCRSTDLGATWPNFSMPISAVKGFGISPNGGVFLASSTNKVYRSTDAGQTWSQPMTVPFTAIRFTFENDSTVFAFAPAGTQKSTLYLSENAGSTWKNISPTGTWDYETGHECITDDGVFCFTSFIGRCIFCTSDRGKTWQKTRNSDSHQFSQPAVIGDLIFGFDANYSFDGFKLIVSDDNGLTWARHPDITDIGLVPLARSGGYLLAQNGSYDNAVILRAAVPNLHVAKLTGHVKKDQNHDCTLQSTDLSLEKWLITATDSLGQKGYATTDSTGFYRLGFVLLDSMATELEVEVRKPNYLWEFCDSLLTVVVSPADDTASHLDYPVDAIVDCPLLEVSIGFWPARPCFSLTAVASWCNLGTVPADSATLTVVLDALIEVDSASLPVLFQSGDTLVFALGSVGIGDCGSLQIFGKLSCDAPLGQSICAEAWAWPDSICGMFPDWSGAELHASAVCAGDSVVDFRIKNIGDAPSTPGLEYIVIEDQILLRTGQVPTLQPAAEILLSEIADGSALRLEVMQEPGHPLSIFSAAWVEGCGSDGQNPPQFGWILPFLGEDGDPFSDHFCREASASYDPNAKECLPRGIGPEHFIKKNQPIDYTIFFQNTGTDTAFLVVLRDTISPFLDLATLRMGAASHPFEWEIYGSGILKIIFKNIKLPDSTTNEMASHGWASFKIDQKNDLALGSVIRNKAGIFFDFNAPILTNETFQTIGEDFLTVSVFPFSDEKGKAAPIQISPNPFSESAFFDLKKGETNEPLLLKIMDSAGRVVRSEKVVGPRFSFERKNLAAGFWIFSIENAENGSVRAAGKLVAR